jgi:hypothetical protein
MMPPTIAEWLTELGEHSPDMVEEAEAIEESVAGLLEKADTSYAAREMVRGLIWIAGHHNKTAVERLEAMAKLLAFEPPIVVNLTELTGWKR